MVNKYKGVDISNLKTINIIGYIEEIFTHYSLNDNNTIDFNNFVQELKRRVNNTDKEYKHIKALLNKEIKTKNMYRDKFFKIATQKDKDKLLEELLEK